MVENAISNPILPNFDFSFFSELQREYMRISGKTYPANLNKMSLYFGVGGFIVFFALVILGEAFRY